MKLSLPRPLFPGLHVTRADEDELSALVDVFIDKLLIEEDAFRVTRRGRVDTAKWKPLRRTDNTAVYRERSAATTPSSCSPKTSRTTHKLVPPFLTVGKVPGSLDELLYGISAPTREALILRASYLDGNVADMEVLHSIRGPTLDEPFSHVSVNWLLLAPHTSFITPRDFVFIDALGTRVLSSGERIGYQFSHTIELKGAGAMSDRGLLRSNFSISTIFREDPANHCVLEYGRTFYAPGGAIPHSLFISLVSRQASSTAAHRTTGQLKKLAFALRQKHAGKWTVAAPLPSPRRGESTPKSKCGVCAKRLHLVNKSRFDCALCARKLCQACSARKEVFFLKADLRVTRLRVTFCTLCVQQAITLPSIEVAKDEFLTTHQQFYYLQPESLSAEGASTLRAIFST